MSKCVSGKGEYGEHVLLADYTCDRCGVFDEDAIMDALRRVVAERDALYAAARNAVDLTRRGGTSLMVGKSIDRLGAIVDHMPNHGAPYWEGGVIADLTDVDDLSPNWDRVRITWNAKGLFTFEVLPTDGER